MSLGLIPAVSDVAWALNKRDGDVHEAEVGSGIRT
jgi:hypothetical protein